MAGRGGRARAEEIHTTRRIEALVTDFASRVMVESGFPPEVVRMAGGRLPAPDPDEESTPSVTDDDMETALNASMARLAENLAIRFQSAAAELARQQAQAAASQPTTIDGEVTDSEPVPALQEADPVAEEIETLERRFTTARAAKSARLRRPREVGHHLPEPDPDPEPEPAPDPEPAQELTVKRQPAPQRGPRRDARGRIVTTLGAGPSPVSTSYPDIGRLFGH